MNVMRYKEIVRACTNSMDYYFVEVIFYAALCKRAP